MKPDENSSRRTDAAVVQHDESGRPEHGLRVPADAADPVGDLGRHADAIRILEQHRADPDDDRQDVNPHGDRRTASSAHCNSIPWRDDDSARVTCRSASQRRTIRAGRHANDTSTGEDRCGDVDEVSPALDPAPDSGPAARANPSVDACRDAGPGSRLRRSRRGATRPPRAARVVPRHDEVGQLLLAWPRKTSLRSHTRCTAGRPWPGFSSSSRRAVSPGTRPHIARQARRCRKVRGPSR